MFQIRPCRNEDFDEVLELLRQLWPDKPLDQAALRTVYDRALASDLQRYVCATNGERIIGFGSLTVKNNLWQEGYLGHVDELVVDGEYRDRGIGTQLLEYIVDLAKQKGCRRIELDSAFHRQKAHEFYERHGFENRGFIFSKVL
jgi:ribosomal protein S18 acetylase RimI-like enzyme